MACMFIYLSYPALYVRFNAKGIPLLSGISLPASDVNRQNAKYSVALWKIRSIRFLLWDSFPSPLVSSKLLNAETPEESRHSLAAQVTSARYFPGDFCMAWSPFFTHLFSQTAGLLPIFPTGQAKQMPGQICQTLHARANVGQKGALEIYCGARSTFQREIPAASTKPSYLKRATSLKLFPCLLVTAAGVTPVGRNTARGQSRGPKACP